MVSPGVGIVGLGFMGRAHLAAYRAAAAAGHDHKLVAVADADAERRAGRVAGGGNLEVAADGALFDATQVRGYRTATELFADPDVDLVSICTPTPSHVDLACAALEAGKHVLVEKPVALASAAARRLATAAEAARAARGLFCMPAHCMRFWPGWDWLKARVDDRSFGAVKSATFRRLGARPTWNAFYADAAASGGALFDMHVHDADFVSWCFGRPDGVAASGDRDHVTALYRYERGPPHVVAEGGWNQAPGFPFRMAYTVTFERATADFDFAREPKLMLAQDGAWRAVDVPGGTGYAGEVAELLACVEGRLEEPRVSMADAVAVTELLERVEGAMQSATAR